MKDDVGGLQVDAGYISGIGLDADRTLGVTNIRPVIRLDTEPRPDQPYLDLNPAQAKQLIKALKKALKQHETGA